MAMSFWPGAAEPAAAESQAEHLAAFLCTALHRQLVVGREIQVARTCLAERKGKRRLRQDGRHHHVVDHHPEGETAAEAHADSTDALAADLAMQLFGERTQPRDDRRGLSHREHRELARDAHFAHRRRHVFVVGRSSDFADKERHHHGESRGDDFFGELHHRRRDARNLVHHDHAWADPFAIRLVGDAGSAERIALPTGGHCRIG